MTGCVIGEVTGLVVATALGWGDVASIALAVGLAFLFGYLLTSIPALPGRPQARRDGPDHLATDTVSTTIMEIIEKVTMLVLPGAMDAYLDEITFSGPMALGFAIAFPFAFLANRTCWFAARATRSCTSTTSPKARAGRFARPAPPA